MMDLNSNYFVLVFIKRLLGCWRFCLSSELFQLLVGVLINIRDISLFHPLLLKSYSRSRCAYLEP